MPERTYPHYEDESGSIPWRSWLPWVVFAIVVMVQVSPSKSYCPQIYRNAAVAWTNGIDLYDDTGGNFIYMPTCAVLYLPLTLVPPITCDVVFRALNILVFGWGTMKLASQFLHRRNERSLLLLSLTTIALSWSAGRIGQMTLLMGGLMLLSLAFLYQDKLWRAAFCLVFAVALKPIAVPLLLLIVVLQPRAMTRVIVTGAGFVFLPFLTQAPNYVAAQYADSIAMLSAATQRGLVEPWANIFWALRDFGCVVPSTAERLTQILAAVVTLGLSGWMMRQRPRQEQLVYLFTFAACYILLFSPRTERNTYALCAPAIAMLTMMHWESDRRTAATIFSALALCLLLSHPLSKALFGEATIWMKPLLCLGFSITSIHYGLRRRISTDNVDDQTTIESTRVAPRSVSRAA